MSRLHYLKYLPLLLILAAIAALYFTGIYKELTFDTLREKHLQFKGYVINHPFLSPLAFIAVYTLSVLLIIPDSILLTLLAGYLFPLPLAILYTLFAETLGAYLFFLAMEEALPLAKKEFLKTMARKFRHHAASYLLFLRWSHLLPFTLVNSFAAYFRVKRWTFLWTTFIGIAPFAYLLATEGHRLSQLFAENRSLSLANIFTLQVKIAFLIFALLALVPLAYHKLKK